MKRSVDFQEQTPYGGAGMEKKIQISLSLYDMMASYVHDHYDPGDSWRYRRIVEGIEEKQEKQMRHNAYSVFKTSQDPDEKETARTIYLDSVGMKKSFRW